MLYSYPRIGHFGLGNKLFVWARAEASAIEHNAKMLAPSFQQFPSIGAILRRERDMRMYRGNFDYSVSEYVRGVRRLELLAFGKKINECDWRPNMDGCIVCFEGLRPGTISAIQRNHAEIKAGLRRITAKKIHANVDIIASEPFIGVHVRRGDFALAGVQTSDEWYVRAIRHAIEIAGQPLPIRIFSDGTQSQLKFLLDSFRAEKLVIMPPAKPLHDIWALSRSAVMVGSSRSSFSMWAVLLGQMPSVWARENAPRGNDLYLTGTHDIEVVD